MYWVPKTTVWVIWVRNWKIIFLMSHSTKVKEFKLIFFAKINATNLEFLNFNFNTEQLTAINHSSRQKNSHNNAYVGLL